MSTQSPVPRFESTAGSFHKPYEAVSISWSFAMNDPGGDVGEAASLAGRDA